MAERELTADGCFAILAKPERWTLICSALPIESQPVRNAAYNRWATTNSHRHTHREILFCFAGETLERFAGQNYHCHPGSVFLIDSNEEHAKGYPRNGKSFIHLWIAMGPDTGAFANIYHQRGGKAAEQRYAPMVLAQTECELLAHCWRVAQQPSPWISNAIRRAVLTSAVFAVVFRAIDNWHTAANSDGTLQRHQEAVAIIQRHIETHLDEAKHLDTLAHLSGYSKFHLSRIFKEVSGQTVHAFIDACRVKKAGDLIRRGVPRKIIAGTLGFSSPVAFSNWLHKTPSLL